MKKSLKIFLCVICLLPLVLLSSCGITQYYTITTTESDSTLGKGNGGSDVAMAEGTEITLSANETKPETNPFICWIKDDNKIVSLEKNYSTTYSQSSSGKYTALFQETTINKTRYSTITNVEIIGASSANLQISYAYTTALQNKILLEDLNIENGSTSTEKRNVLYFGGASGETNKIEFSFSAVLNVTNGSSVTRYNLTFANILVDTDNPKAGTSNYVTFDDNGNCTLSSTPLANGIVVNITFSKLTLNLLTATNA